MRTIRYFFRASLVATAAGLAGPVAAQTATLTTLHFFAGAGATPPDGAFPRAGLIADSTGALYGTTAGGGVGGVGVSCSLNGGCGTVFKLAPPAKGGNPWTETVLYRFTGGSDGTDPNASLTFGTDGALYGTTQTGGGTGCNGVGCGTVFKLTPSGGGIWSESVLYSFTGGNDGGIPFAGLIMDASGALYGTTLQGGDVGPDLMNPAEGNGTVFKLTASGGGTWSESVLYAFTGGNDGSIPSGGLIMDASGALYGTTDEGGASASRGTVFKLTPPGGGTWSESVLYSFKGGSDGEFPHGGLIMDAAGALYGTTQNGGASEEGTVFKLTPAAGDTWSESVLYAFTGGSDGGDPAAGLIMDAAGALYGTTDGGGASQDGTVFKLIPAAGVPWTENVLWSFSGSDGAFLEAGLTSDASGALYGTTSGGAGVGTAFKLVTAASFSGSQGQANCIGKSVSPLAQKYGGLSAAAAASPQEHHPTSTGLPGSR